MTYYYLTNETGKLFFNFIYSGGKYIKLKNTRRECQSVLYTFSDAYFFSAFLNDKKHPTKWIMQKEFYKHYKTYKLKKDVSTTKKRRFIKNSISGTGSNG